MSHKMDEHAVRILADHLNVNESKPVSYLPSKTITQILGMGRDRYMKMALEKGLCAVAYDESESCVAGGAVYVYHYRSLGALLFRHRETLLENGWPSDTAGFIRQVASNWLNERDPILLVVREAFGGL